MKILYFLIGLIVLNGVNAIDWQAFPPVICSDGDYYVRTSGDSMTGNLTTSKDFVASGNVYGTNFVGSGGLLTSAPSTWDINNYTAGTSIEVSGHVITNLNPYLTENIVFYNNSLLNNSYARIDTSNTFSENQIIGDTWANGGMELHTDGKAFVQEIWINSGNTTVVDGQNINGSIYPKADNVFEFGNSSNRWNDIYAVNFHGDGSALTGISAGGSSPWQQGVNTIYNDSASIKVGIGTTVPGIATAPTVALTVHGGTDENDRGSLELVGYESTGDAAVAGLAFFNNASTDADQRLALIQGARDGANDKGQLWFYTNDGSSIGTRMTIDNTGNVGIGTTTPSEHLHISGTGDQYIQINSTDDNVVGLRFIRDDPSAFDWQMIDSSGDLVFQRSDDNGNSWTSHLFVEGSATGLGNVGIGTTGPNQGKVEVKGGSVCVDTNSDDDATQCIASESDIRLKQNIKPIDNALDKIMQVQGVEFDWRWNDSSITENYPLITRFKNKPHAIGIISQDLEKIFPEAIMQETIGQQQYQQINYELLVAPLIEAVKELKQEIQELNQQNIELTKRIEKLENE